MFDTVTTAWICALMIDIFEDGVAVYSIFMSVDHSRDALMQRPYKVLVMAM